MSRLAKMVAAGATALAVISGPALAALGGGGPKGKLTDAKAKGVKFGCKPKLIPHQQREAIRRRDRDGETLRTIARTYNVRVATISRLHP